jgi:hypothetical protein
MKTIAKIIFFSLLFIANRGTAQKYFTKNGTIVFNSKATLATIEANNKAGTIVLDSKSGAIACSILIKGFTFEKALMQKHFNESYMESDKFPKAELTGKITNNADIKYATDGVYTAKLTGKLTIHGVTKDYSNNLTITVKKGKVSGKAQFTVLIKDYNISIPAAVKDQVSNTVTISVSSGDMGVLK